MKIDALNEYFVKDVTFGSCTVHALCAHKITGGVKLFGWGRNQFGQLGDPDLTLVRREPHDMTSLFVESKSPEQSEGSTIFGEDRILSVSSGGCHTLVLT